MESNDLLAELIDAWSQFSPQRHQHDEEIRWQRREAEDPQQRLIRQVSEFRQMLLGRCFVRFQQDPYLFWLVLLSSWDRVFQEEPQFVKPEVREEFPHLFQPLTPEQQEGFRSLFQNLDNPWDLLPELILAEHWPRMLAIADLSVRAVQEHWRNIYSVDARRVRERGEHLRRVAEEYQRREREDPDNHASLAVALQTGASYEVIDRLIKGGADVKHCLVEDDVPPLIYLLQQEYFSDEVLQCLCTAGADINAVDRNGETAIIHAARHVFPTPMARRVLLYHGADANALDRNGVPVLTLAVKSRHYNYNDWIELLNHGADINGRDREGWTPLMHLCRIPFYPSVASLNSIPPLDDLIANDPSVRERLIGRGRFSMDCMLHIRMQYGGYSRVKAFLNIGDPLNIDLPLPDGRTALLIASQAGRSEHVSALLDAGANFDVRMDTGENALQLAAAAGHSNVVNVLEIPELEMNVDRHGRHALLSALLNGHTDVAKIIIIRAKKESDKFLTEMVQHTDHNGHSALPLAAQLGSIGLVDALSPFATQVQIGQAQVAASLWQGDHMIRVNIHHSLLRAFCEQYGTGGP